MKTTTTYELINQNLKFLAVVVLVSFTTIQLTSYINTSLFSQDFETTILETTNESEQNETNEEIQEDEIFTHKSVFSDYSEIKINLNVNTKFIYKVPYSPLHTPPPEI